MEGKNLQRESSSDDSSISSEDEIAKTLQIIQSKGKKGRKRGRRSVWEDHIVDDLVDIICNTEAFTQKLVYENTKKVPTAYSTNGF